MYIRSTQPYLRVGRVRKPSVTDPIQSMISSRTSRWKKDSTKRHHHRHHQRQQVNSNFPHRWSPASLTSNNYFYLFLYLYTTRITINNNTQNLKSPKKQYRRAAVGRQAINIACLGGGERWLQLDCGRPTLALSSALVCMEDSWLISALS